jgi:toxin-antitoxin system PIN domain toxin
VLLDVNVLLKGLNEDDIEYPRVHAWLRDALEREPSVAIPWLSALGFLRIATNRKVMRRSGSFDQAWDLLQNLLSHPRVWMPNPTDAHAATFHRLMGHTPKTHSWVSDAHLAALAIEHNLTLVSTDGGFSRFPDLRFLNPLAVRAS